MKIFTVFGIIFSLIVVSVTSEHQKFEKISKFLSQNDSVIGFECKYDLENINMLELFRGK